MENVLFLQSEVKDPYAFYERMLKESPVYFDRINNIHAVYGYRDCVEVLQNSSAYIPPLQDTPALNTNARSVLAHLARVNNPPVHAGAKQAAQQWMKRWQPHPVAVAMQHLLGEPRRPASVAWVETIARRLPAMYLLKGFGFGWSECETFVWALERLIKILKPVKVEDDVPLINEAIDKVLPLATSCASRLGVNDQQNMVFAANLIGLVIQSYEAGRGLLSNTMLQALAAPDAPGQPTDYFERLTRETLRFDPPVQNTRRILTQPITPGKTTINTNEQVLVVLASANRDATAFKSPHDFNPHRTDNPPYLTFGEGAHRCVAEHLSIQLTTEALHYMFTKFKKLTLASSLYYEAKVNVRLPGEMRIEVD